MMCPRKSGSPFAVVALCALVAACQSGPMMPSPTPTANYAGTWSGLTFQGESIALTVSSAQQITDIAVNYNINGCTGSTSFHQLAVGIGDLHGPVGPTSDWSSGPPGQPGLFYIHAHFTSSTTATGSVAFVDYPGCGNGGGQWTAFKR
jgi:hypothetical protein